MIGNGQSPFPQNPSATNWMAKSKWEREYSVVTKIRFITSNSIWNILACWILRRWGFDYSISKETVALRPLRHLDLIFSQKLVLVNMHLEFICETFGSERYVFNNTGSMTWKNGSDATWVYKFTDKKQISETFEPWYETHVYPFLGTEGIKHWEKFKECRNLISNRKNWNLDDAQACAKQIYTLTSYKGRDRKLSCCIWISLSSYNC